MDQFFFVFFAGTSATALMVLVAEAATHFLTPQSEQEDSDG
ncbi:hypothetical protein [Kitasatospora sp. NPDC092286]